MIQVKSLDKHFNKHKRNSIHVLNDISLSFAEKGLVVLLGPSGSGKTTLLNVIGGLDKVDRGRIQFYDHTINKYKANVWDKIRTEEIGYIFQNYYLMSDLSVFDNVAFVLKMIGITDKAAIEERVNYILTEVGMYRFRKKRASQLSGGQQQRVAIARALVKNPKVIIADEPTGNLDSRNTLEIMNIIKSISLSKLVILVTHEREIANFYGERIIELKDGRIISDVTNESTLDHNFASENVIYLKDLNEVSKLGGGSLKASLYSDTDEVNETNIRLIIKNKTLYLDITSSIEKVKLIDKESHIELKDEHFKKKTRAEMLETTFDHAKLDHSNLSKQKKLSISFKTSFWIAFKKFLRFGAKGKMMLVIFAISGALVANTVINIYTVLTLNYERYLTRDENYIEIDIDNSETTNRQDIYDEIMAVVDGSTYYLLDNRYASSLLSIKIAAGQHKMIGNQIRLEYADQLSSSHIVYGRLPENEFEVVISTGTYSQGTFMDTNFNDVGIWSVDGFINEYITVSSFENSNERLYKVVGISNANYKAVYVYDYYDIIYLSGNAPDPIPTKEAFELNLVLSMLNTKVYLYTENPSDTMLQLEALGYQTKLTNAEAIQRNNNEVAAGLAANLAGSGFLVAGALLAFYFVMRSSMISRIYEISVYRALGVKKSEIFGSFAVEITLLTLVSSFVGFAGMTFILAMFAASPLAAFANFTVDFFTVLIGLVIVFGANLIIGLLPMVLLLKKTPAQIISSYDM